jgi:hypothetical protein
MLICELICLQPESTDTEMVVHSKVDEKELVIRTERMSPFRVGLRRLLLRRYSARFHVRSLWEALLKRWWRLRGY